MSLRSAAAASCHEAGQGGSPQLAPSELEGRIMLQNWRHRRTRTHTRLRQTVASQPAYVLDVSQPTYTRVLPNGGPRTGPNWTASQLAATFATHGMAKTRCWQSIQPRPKNPGQPWSKHLPDATALAMVLLGPGQTKLWPAGCRRPGTARTGTSLTPRTRPADLRPPAVHEQWCTNETGHHWCWARPATTRHTGFAGTQVVPST